MWSDIFKYSTTHQGTLQEGRIDGVRKIIMLLGTTKFGPPDERWSSLLSGINDLDELNNLTDRILTANSWESLFAATS